MNHYGMMIYLGILINMTYKILKRVTLEGRIEINQDEITMVGKSEDYPMYKFLFKDGSNAEMYQCVAFGDYAFRLAKMHLKEESCITITGDLQENESATDENYRYSIKLHDLSKTEFTETSMQAHLDNMKSDYNDLFGKVSKTSEWLLNNLEHEKYLHFKLKYNQANKTLEKLLICIMILEDQFWRIKEEYNPKTGDLTGSYKLILNRPVAPTLEEMMEE